MDAAGYGMVGELLVMGHPIRIDRPVGLEETTDPTLQQVARLARRDLDRIVDAGQADALASQRVELVEMLHQDVPAAAVAKHHHGGRVVQCMGILRPALVDDRLGLGHILLDALGQEQAAGMVLVLGVAVAGTAGEEHDLLLGVGFHQVVVLEFPETDVAELDLHGRAGVDLQSDDAVLAGHLVFIDQFAHQVPVDLLDDAVSLGGDVVLVPVAVLDELGQFGRVAEAFDLLLAVLADRDLLAAAGQSAAKFSP